MTIQTNAELEASLLRLETDLALDRGLLATIRHEADIFHNEEDYPTRGETLDQLKVEAYETNNRIAANEGALAWVRAELSRREKNQAAYDRACAHVQRTFENHFDC